MELVCFLGFLFCFLFCMEEAQAGVVLFLLFTGTFEGHLENFRTQNSGIRARGRKET